MEQKIKIVQTIWNDRASILWIESESEEDIKAVFAQAQYVENKNVRVMNYYPGQVFDRMKEIDAHCKKEKEKNETLKYQIRLGYKDLELFNKIDGATSWSVVPINLFGPVSTSRVFYYSRRSWEEQSPPKGRSNKRNRSQETSPGRICKKPMIELRPENMTKEPVQGNKNTSNVGEKTTPGCDKYR